MCFQKRPNRYMFSKNKIVTWSQKGGKKSILQKIVNAYTEKNFIFGFSTFKLVRE